MKKYLYPAIGIGAFIIGGLLAREKAFEGLEMLENVFSKESAATVESSEQ